MITKIQALFREISGKLENNATPVFHYFALFFAILFVRLTLEFFSSNRLFIGMDVVHIGLWFTFIVLAFLLELHLFSKENIVKIAKLVISCFTIALSAPIIDLIVNQGKPAKMNYLELNHWQEVVWAYCTVGGSSLTRGATLGIRIEIGLLVIACFNYVQIKRNSVFWGIIAAITIYTVLFLSGAIPLFLQFLIQVFHLQYQPDDQSTVLLLLSLDIGLLFLIFGRYSPDSFRKMYSSLTWGIFLLTLTEFTIGGLVARKLYPDNWTFNPTTLFWVPLLILMTLSYGVILGTLRQYKISFSPKNLLIIGCSFGILLLIGSFISYKTIFIVGLIGGLWFLKYSPALHIYKAPILSPLFTAMIAISFQLLGFCSFGAPMVGYPKMQLFLFFFQHFSLAFALDCLSQKYSLPPFLSILFKQKAFILGIFLLSTLAISSYFSYLSWSQIVFLVLSLPVCYGIYFPPRNHQQLLLGLTISHFVFIFSYICQ